MGTRLARAARQIRGDWILVIIDVALAGLTYFLVFEMRFDFEVPHYYWDDFQVFLPVACLLQVLATWIFGCYGRSWRHASIDEARRLLSAGLCTMVVLVAAFSWGDERVPLTVLLGGPIVVTFLYGLVRFQSRLFAFRRFGDPDDSGVRIVVVGAGGTGSAVLRELRHNPQLGLVPVAVVDDDRSLQGRRVHEVPVAGTLAELPGVIDDFEVHQVLFAIPSADSSTLRAVADAATSKQVPVRVIRAASSWVNGMARLRDLRDLEIEDLLGRVAIDIDLAPVRTLLQGKRVMVTGGGGWIGSEIVRQVAAFEPASLVLLDHDETHLHDALQGVGGNARIALCDIRDAPALDAVFAAERPEVVFHAAAHKHVSILEEHPCEAIRTNVVGTSNIVDVCTRFGVTHLVCISTDKAAVPTGVMAASKWIAEQIVLARAPARRRVLLGALRQRAREPWQRDPAVPTPDRERRPRHRHRSAHDPLLHEHQRSGAARDARRGGHHRPPRARTRDGRAGQHLRAGRANDPAVRLPARHRHPHRDHGNAAGREAHRRRSSDRPSSARRARTARS